MNIQLSNVSAGYEKNNHIITDLSVTFNEGGICGILGPNGSGKTTLLRVLSGTLPNEGNVYINLNSANNDDIQETNQTSKSNNPKSYYTKIEISKTSRKQLARYIAMTPQFSSTYFSYNVYDTIMMGRYAHMGTSFRDILGGTSKKDKEIADMYIEKMGLKDIKNKSISQLSGGQLERVLLARTFVQKTPIILLDEPTNHLDIKYQSELTDYMKDWASGSTEVDGTTYKNTIISVFHNIELAAYLSNEIILMKEGNIIKKGPANEVLNSETLENVYDVDVLGYKSKIIQSLTSTASKKNES